VKPLVDSPPKRPAGKRNTPEKKPSASQKGAWHHIGGLLKKGAWHLALVGSFGGLPTVSPSRIALTTVLYTDRVYLVLSAKWVYFATIFSH